MGYVESAFCRISCCELRGAANINIPLVLNLENSLQAPDMSVLPLFFFFFNLIHVTATVLPMVSNSLCSFPGKRKSLPERHIWVPVPIERVISRFLFVSWSESRKHVCHLWCSLNKETRNTLRDHHGSLVGDFTLWGAHAQK